MEIIKTHNKVFVVDEINFAEKYGETIEIHYYSGKEYRVNFDGSTIKERKNQATIFFEELVLKMEEVARRKEVECNV